MDRDTLSKSVTPQEVVKASTTMYSVAASAEQQWLETIEALYRKRIPAKNPGQFIIPQGDQDSVRKNLYIPLNILQKAVQDVCKLAQGALQGGNTNQNTYSDVNNALITAFAPIRVMVRIPS